jgi:hypothetical protein
MTDTASRGDGLVCACATGELTLEDTSMTKGKKLTTVKLDWNEVYYTSCPLVSAINVDQELGWTKEECKKLGVQYLYLRSRAENDWYRHYIKPEMMGPLMENPSELWLRRDHKHDLAFRPLETALEKGVI